MPFFASTVCVHTRRSFVVITAVGPNSAAITVRPRPAWVGCSRPCDAHDGHRILQARTGEQGAASRAAREAPGSNRVNANASGERERMTW